jgi:hypothetical protein
MTHDRFILLPFRQYLPSPIRIFPNPPRFPPESWLALRSIIAPIDEIFIAGNRRLAAYWLTPASATHYASGSFVMNIATQWRQRFEPRNTRNNTKDTKSCIPFRAFRFISWHSWFKCYYHNGYARVKRPTRVLARVRCRRHSSSDSSGRKQLLNRRKVKRTYFALFETRALTGLRFNMT